MQGRPTVFVDANIFLEALGKDRGWQSSLEVLEKVRNGEVQDLIIGVHVETLDLYLVPTRFAQAWGKSKATSILQPLRNN